MPFAAGSLCQSWASASSVTSRRATSSARWAGAQRGLEHLEHVGELAAESFKAAAAAKLEVDSGRRAERSAAAERELQRQAHPDERGAAGEEHHDRHQQGQWFERDSSLIELPLEHPYHAIGPGGRARFAAAGDRRNQRLGLGVGPTFAGGTLQVPLLVAPVEVEAETEAEQEDAERN
ncbi:MAG: hypothetical protein ACREQD_00255 [Candidatus Binataceae bacterium]